MPGDNQPTSRNKLGEKGRAAFAQMEYLARLARNALKAGDIPRAIERLLGCIRMARGVRGAKERSRLFEAFAITDHLRVGYCHAALGPGHYGKALGHLNVVRRYLKWFRKNRHWELDKTQTGILCRALAEMARICNLLGRHDRALLCADECLDELYRGEVLQGGPAADLIQMLGFAARGEALRGLWHGGEVVVRHCEQVLLHYRKYVSVSGASEDRKRLLRTGGDCIPWHRDRLHPENMLEQAEKALNEIRNGLSAPMRRLADRILKEQQVWRESGE